MDRHSFNTIGISIYGREIAFDEYPIPLTWKLATVLQVASVPFVTLGEQNDTELPFVLRLRHVNLSFGPSDHATWTARICGSPQKSLAIHRYIVTNNKEKKNYLSLVRRNLQGCQTKLLSRPPLFLLVLNVRAKKGIDPSHLRQHS